MKLTQQQINEWLGSDNTLEEAIEIITDIVNGAYKPEQLKQDVEDYFK